MDDWLEDTQDFTNKDSSGNLIPMTQSKLNKNDNNLDINDAFDQVANHFVEYKTPQAVEKPPVQVKQEISVDKNILNIKEINKKKKKKFEQKKIITNNKLKVKLNDEEEYDDYNDEYDNLYDKYD